MRSRCEMVDKLRAEDNMVGCGDCIVQDKSSNATIGQRRPERSVRTEASYHLALVRQGPPCENVA